jgi:hypothetical protein
MVERKTHAWAELVDGHVDTGHVHRHRVSLVRVSAEADDRTSVATKRQWVERQQQRSADVFRVLGRPVQGRLDAVKSRELLALGPTEPFAAIPSRL